MGKPTFISIYEILKKEIENKVILAGSLLPTESELAIKYHVSRPTISKAYNKLQEDGYVKKKIGFGTKVTFEEKSKVRFCFGLLLPGAGESEIFSIINDRLLRLSNEKGFDSLWNGATANNAIIRRSLIESCCENYISQKVDGVFFSPLERVENADEINRMICKKLNDASIPLVLIDRDIVDFPERSEYDLVSIDNYRSGFIIGEHLLSQGCERVLFFYRPNSAYSVQQRISGVSAAARAHNLSFGNSDVICAETDDIDCLKSMPINSGKTGIVCANDSTAAMLMSSLEGIGIIVGKDVLICGYDDMKYAQHLTCPLTSYRQPCEDIADVSVELMFRRVHNRSVVPLSVQLSGTLIVRKSSEFVMM